MLKIFVYKWYERGTRSRMRAGK